MLEIDGAQGEGGGQVLRTALALSLVTARGFRITNVRAARDRPGLLRQHLTAVRAAQAVSAARTAGDALGSRTLSFVPGPVRAGAHAFAVGTAGSTLLVLQAVLPALLVADGPSRFDLEGGTHNPAAPSWEFFARALVPRLERMGPRLAGVLDRPGFHPAGGGRVGLDVSPSRTLQPFAELERGTVRSVTARAIVSMLPERIGRTECEALAAELGLPHEALSVEVVTGPVGPGNALLVTVESDSGLEVFTAVGRPGLRAEDVAAAAAIEVREYLDAGVPIGRHLADQLLVPMALAGGGAFRTLEPSRHARTVSAIVGQFLDVDVRWSRDGGPGWLVEVARAGQAAKEGA